MKAYLDNNILIDYEKDSSILFSGVNVCYRCSYIHFVELMESTRNFEERKEQRFSTIESLTGNIFMTNTDNNVVAEEINTCSRYYETLHSPLLRMFQHRMKERASKWLVGKDPDTLIKDFGIDKKRINNYSAEELIKEHGDFIHYYVTASDDGNRMASFMSFFNVLDLLGFWRDKVKEGSMLNRTYDAQHAYFATGCDYFVTNDHRTCMKANVLYQYYGYKTKALSLKEFNELLEKE